MGVREKELRRATLPISTTGHVAYHVNQLHKANWGYGATAALSQPFEGIRRVQDYCGTLGGLSEAGSRKLTALNPRHRTAYALSAR